MKTAFKLSILSNLCLLSLLLWLLQTHRQNSVPPSDSIPAAVGQTTAPPAVQSERSESAPFQWSQLESSDYRVYVANLRAIGCPPQTLRDIIQADVGSLYSAKRRQMQLSESGSGPWSRQEERQLVAGLVGEPPEPASAAPQPAPPATNTIAVPLVFQSVDLAALGFNAGQKAAIAELRERFVAQIGGPNQDANDPGYRARWLQLQPESDEMLRGMIGINAFQNYQLQAAGTPAEAY
jgi:hypothetical protein